MKLSTLHLEHFRNYTRLDFDFPADPIVVLSGENAQGKTSFLEAIYLLALTKSFRTGDHEFLKQFEKDYFRIEAKTGDSIHLEMCEIHSPHHQRVLKKNGTKISTPKFLGHIKAVLFRPEDLHILTGEPALRRKYLNTMLIQTVPGYIKQLQTYQKLLTQRNALLLQIKLGTTKASSLDIWDPPLAEAGAALTTSRLELVEFLQNQLCEQTGGVLHTVEYSSPIGKIDKINEKDSGLWTSRSEKLNSKYGNDDQLRARAQQLSTDENDTTERDFQSFPKSAEITQSLLQARPHDIRSTHTSVGPHRDDLKLKIRGKSLETASRGELRSALMALKQAEIAWFIHKTGSNPIILLDDVFSELDTERKNSIFEPMIDHLAATTQIIMTVADGNPLPTSPKLRSALTVRKVHAGQISIA